MKELKIPVFDSYTDIQQKAVEEASYIGSEILPRMRNGNIPYNLGVLIDAAEHPDRYGFQDKLGKPLPGRSLEFSMFLVLNGGVSVDYELFEKWYHKVHPDGVKRLAFFRSLSEQDIKEITCKIL